MDEIELVCSPRSLPKDHWVDAARRATEVNPANYPRLERIVRLVPDFEPTPERIAVVTAKYWGLQGVRLTVGFLDNPPADLRKRILLHMNAWANGARKVEVGSQALSRSGQEKVSLN
jgi:hypothetical protein